MAQIRDMIDQEQEAKLKEQLEFLLAAAKGKLALYQQQIDEMFLNPEAVGKIQIVGHRAILTYSEYRADISKSVDDQLKGVIDTFLTGTPDGAKAGVSTLVKLGLETILGSDQIGESEQCFYAVVPEHLAFIRLDVKAWRYNFSNTGVIGTAKNAFCFFISKSVVDHTKLTSDELIFFVSSLVGDNIQEVSGYLEELRSLWALVEGKSPNEVAESYSAKVFASKS